MLIQRNSSKKRTAAFLFFVATILIFAVSASRSYAADQVKIGYINTDRVISAVIKQTPEYEELSKELEKRQAEAERRRAEIDKLEEDFKANKVIWSEDKTKEQATLIRNKIDDLKVYSEGAQRFFDVEQRKILRGLAPEISKTIRKIGERDGYSMIFDKSLLLYVSPDFDLTDTIIREMSANEAE